MRKTVLAALLCLFGSATLAISEGGGAAPAMVAAPAAVGAPAPIGISGTSALSPLAPAAAGTASQTGLPPVISEKGASPLPLGEVTPPPAPGKDGAPAREGTAAGDAVGGAEAAGLSPLEQTMSADEASGTMRPQPFRLGKMNQFGYSFFKQSTAFAPVVDVPVGPDYIIGPGDTLVLSVSGSLDGTFPLEVNRSGEVILPKVGAVRVWGVAFGKVPELLKASLSQAFRNVQVNVTMGKLRLMKVYLVGEVGVPGDYNISALSTVINALAAAGGPTRSGSLRTIQVKRDGKVVETVDLYEFFLKGDKSSDIRLQTGDTVYVPIIGKVAGIGGNVKRPGIYELKSETALKELLELAGGFKPSGYLNRLQISRLEAHDKKVVADFKLDPKLTEKELAELTAGIAIQDLDIVKIFPIDFTVRDNVQLDGYVLRPGPYALKPGMRVKDLIGTDNLLPETYPDTIEITRLISPDFHPEKIYVNLDRAMLGNELDNILLTEFDNVRIFSRWEMEEMPRIRIGGEVLKPGDYRLTEKMTLRDLVFTAGNVRKTASLKNAEITRNTISKDGVVSHLINVDLDEALKGNPKDNILLKDMDEVVVRRIPEWKEETGRYATLLGEVLYPGVYPIQKGEKLSSLIRRAGGYTERAYLKGAKFTRKSVAEMQQKRMDEIIARSEQEVMRKQQELSSVASSKDELEATRTALNGMMLSLEKLKQAKALGRISLALGSLDKLEGSSYDLVLQGGDALEIPQSTNSIMVAGEVYSPTTVIQLPDKDVAYYLQKAGGPTTNADESEMYVIRTDGTVVSSREMDGFFSNGFMDMPLDAGDTVVVPQELDKIAWMREIKDIAFILGQTALAAGVLIAAGL